MVSSQNATMREAKEAESADLSSLWKTPSAVSRESVPLALPAKTRSRRATSECRGFAWRYRSVVASFECPIQLLSVAVSSSRTTSEPNEWRRS
jgi:hypothetical protein